MEKHEAGTGKVRMKREQATILNRVFKEGLIRQVTFEQRHKGNRDPAT